MRRIVQLVTRDICYQRSDKACKFRKESKAGSLNKQVNQ
jgi:hypothetical protein